MHIETPNTKHETQITSCHYPAWPPPVKVPLTVLPEHPCVYLPDRNAQMQGFLARRMDGAAFDRFMGSGFRRSGKLFYQPICRGCRQCIPLRVPTDRFTPSKSQRRNWRANAHLQVSVGPPRLTDEKADLYARYLTQRHGRPEDEASPESLESFLYDSPVDALEMEYRDANGHLLAVGLCDVSESGLSSVYFYFDPLFARLGLGTYGALFEIDFARQNKVPYFYIGYWVPDCPTMKYKSTFRPYETLDLDGVWR